MKASVIIPSYNACERLYYNLLSLNMQSCDREDFEVIVVDDGSKDNTPNMLSNFKANFKFRPIILKQNTGRANARNMAISEAKGDVLIFNDSDMIAEREYIKKHIDAHEEAGTVVSGMNWNRIYTYYYKDFTGSEKERLENQMKAMGHGVKYGNLQPIVTEADIINGRCFEYAFIQPKYQNTENCIINSYGNNLEGYFFPWILFVTNNCSAYRDDILKAGCFDSSFLTWGCEDLDLGYRLYRNNCRFVKAIDINSIHQEHPVNHRRSVSDNIYFFTSKFDTIDLLLYYYGNSAGINNHTANTILYELESFKDDDRYHWFTELYRKLLTNLREANYKSGRSRSIQDIKALRENIVSDMDRIRDVLCNIEKEGKLPETASSFRTLLKKALGPKLNNIKM